MPITIDGTSGITFPAGGTGNPAGTVVGSTDTQTLTNKTIGSGYAGSTITRGTAQNSTSGTSILFTGVPSWAKRVAVMFRDVSTSGTSNWLVQVGSGSLTTTGYTSSASTNAAASATNGFLITQTVTAATSQSGIVTLANITGNTWVATSLLAFNNASIANVGGGFVALSGVLDRVNITTAGGTDTFDAGSINIMWE